MGQRDSCGWRASSKSTLRRRARERLSFAGSSRLELPSSDGVPAFSARDAIVCVLEHLRVAREKPAPRGRANAALDLHYTYRIVRQAAKESGESSGSKVTAALTFAVELRFPAVLDVDYRQGVV